METLKRFLSEEWKRAAKEALSGWIKQEFIALLKLVIPIVSDACYFECKAVGSLSPPKLQYRSVWLLGVDRTGQ